MDSLPTVLLKPGEADRIIAGHPWVYHGEILRVARGGDASSPTPATRASQPLDGEIVQVKDHRQRLIGTGFFNSKSKIVVRVLSPERVEVDEKFFQERIRAALAVRQKYLPGRHFIPRRQCRERFFERPHRGQIRGCASRADFIARHGPAQIADCRRAAKCLFAARDSGAQRHGIAQV